MLDTVNPYNGGTNLKLVEAGHSTRPIRDFDVSDSPQLIAPYFGFYNYAEAQDNFNDYIQFQPYGEGNIPITIGMVTWGWHGKATKTGGVWSLVINTTNGPSLDSANDSFPSWTQVYSVP